MIIKNGFVFQENKCFQVCDLYIEQGRIVSDITQVSDATVINAEDMLVLPGLIDIHSHGAVGYDFSDGDMKGLEKILTYQYDNGVTSYCPTTMTLPKEKLLKIYHNIRNCNVNRVRENDHGSHGMSRIAGIHMEGPFLDPVKKGAHQEVNILPPDVRFFQECNAACGNLIRLITLAPNMDGALDFIKEVKDVTTVSLGHSSADYRTARAAFQAGASHVTHLFNAMNQLGHREPGLIGAAAENENCMAELICDGVHVHESMIRAAFRLFPGRIILISDSMRAAGMGEGVYELGGQQVTVKENRALLPDGTIAGSVTNLYDCMRNAVSYGIPLEEAIAAATMNPAKSIGIFHEVGSLTPGKRADVILTDKNLNLLRVIAF